MNIDDKVSKLENQYKNKEKRKVLYGWYLWDYLLIQKVLKNVVTKLIEEFGVITFCGDKEDILFFKKKFAKLNNIYFVTFDDDIFLQRNQFYPIDEVEKRVGAIRGVACVITGPSRRWLEMAIIYNEKTCIDIFDELRIYGIQIQDKNWKGYNGLKPIKKGIIRLLSKIPFAKEISVVESMNSYFKYIDGCYEGVEDIFVFNSIIQQTDNDARKMHYMRRRIITYLSLREFDLLKKSIAELRREYGEHVYDKLEFEIQTVLDEVKEILKKRNQEDIIIQWCDAVPYEDLHKWNGYKKYRDNGVEFSDVYSIVTYTHPTIISILYEQLYMDGKLYNKKSDRKLETSFGQRINSLGYDCDCVSTHFEGDLQDIHIKNKYTKDRIYILPASLNQWYGIVHLCETTQPCVLFIHNVLETHTPFYYSGMENTWFDRDRGDYSDIELGYIQKAFQYQEKLISNFIDMLNPNKATVIIMSDHGRNDQSRHRWHDIHCHPFFLVYGNKIPKNKVIDGFFQYDQLGELIEQIILDKFCPEKLVKEYACIQGEDYYSKSYCDKVLKRYEEHKNEKDTWMEFVQYLGVITKEAKYIKFPIGERYYNLKKNRRVEMSEVDKLQLETLKKYIKADFVDLKESDRYKNTLELYKKIGLIDQNGEWVRQG